MTQQTKTIAESNNFIVLDKYTARQDGGDRYQSEEELERELIQDLRNQGYEYLPDLTSPSAMLANVRTQLQVLNNVVFTDNEWRRFTEEYLDNPGDTIIDKTRKIHTDYICDLPLMAGVWTIFTLLTRKNRSVTKCRLSASLSRPEPMPTAMMRQYWSTACRWYRLS